MSLPAAKPQDLVPHAAEVRSSGYPFVRYPDRIGYVHLKAVDPAVMEIVRREDLGFAEAVRRGAMVEPPNGEPAMEPLLHQLEGLGVDLFTIVEQDLFPCDPDVPFPIACRTQRYLTSCSVSWRC